jgi:hypothetical protein
MPIALDKLLAWWLSPFSGASLHEPETWMIWHARAMVAAWGVLLPLGAIAARYYKVTKQQNWPYELDNPAWWHAHRLLQYAGVALMLVGVGLAWNQSGSASQVAVWHTYLGWSVTLLGVLQVVSAWLRGSKGGPTDTQLRGDHYDMTPHRQVFEGLHKTCGWLAISIAVLTVVLGLVAADAPRWMALTLALWWIALAVFAQRLQAAGRCIDTYQAIWGPDAIHPGNERPHVGWGARRPRVDREKI